MEQTKNELNKMNIGQWFLRIVHGALIGVGAILPGVSGGVLCVLFGVYQPMMALFSHPIKALKQYYRLFIPIIIGWIIGFVGLAELVHVVFSANKAIASCLFFGLIAGTIPSLWREAGQKGRNKKNLWVFAISFLLLFALLFVVKIDSAHKEADMKQVTSQQASDFVAMDDEGGQTAPVEAATKEAEQSTPVVTQPDTEAAQISGWLFFLCGVVWGLSLVLPGLSSSSILLFIGLYEPMTKGIGSLGVYAKDAIAYILGKGGEAFPPISNVEWICILPLLAGILFTALISARFVNYLLETHYAMIYHVILGVVCASTLCILPFTEALAVSEILWCVVTSIIGCVAAFGLDMLGTRIKAKNNIE